MSACDIGVMTWRPRARAARGGSCLVFKSSGSIPLYAYRELVRLVIEGSGSRTALVPAPFLVWEVLAAVTALLPSTPLTRDQVKLMKRDNVVGRGALTLGDLGIRPVALEEVLADCI